MVSKVTSPDLRLDSVPNRESSFRCADSLCLVLRDYPISSDVIPLGSRQESGTRQLPWFEAELSWIPARITLFLQVFGSRSRFWEQFAG